MKLKRLFTAVLSTALALSLCAMPAMAVDAAADDTTAPVKTSTSTIDTQKEGSITIYKRAELKTKSNVAGTGEKVETPNGDVLPNAGFSVYTVLEAGELVKYYDGLSQETEITVDSCFENDKPHTADNLKSAIKSKQKGTEQFTDASEGKVVFNNLPVGLYLVIETTSPAAVTQKVEPFLVSIPMTRIGDKTEEEEKNQNQKEWLYDVTVYPKNSIAKGNVTLEKKGVTGAKVESLTGVTFELYKKNDRNGEQGQPDYTKAMTKDTGTDGRITFENLTKGSYYLQETGYAQNKDKGYILNTTGKFAFDVDADGHVVPSTDDDLDGKVKDGSFVINTDKTAQVQLTVNNYRPDIEKTVTKRDGTTTEHEADYGIGDAVPFTLTIDVPANVASLKTFKVTDTTNVNQLKHNENPVTVKGIKADTGNTEVDFAKDTDYTLNIDTNGTMTIDFGTKKSDNFKSVAGGKIIIDYTATVQSGAIVAGDGNVNTAQIVYSRTTNTEIDEGTDGNKPYEITDKGVVYTFGLNIHKTGKGGTTEGENLEGVTFDLYKMVESYELEGGIVKTTIRNVEYTDSDLADAVKLGLTTNPTEKWIKIKVDTLQTDADGKASVKGLPSGTYKLVETKTVKGYNLLSKPVDAKLNLTYATEWKTTTEYDKDGNQTKKETNTTTYTRDSNPATPGEMIEIVNRAGFTLPVTGGFGTLLFSGIGVLLVLAGVGVLFSLKKKPNRA